MKNKRRTKVTVRTSAEPGLVFKMDVDKRKAYCKNMKLQFRLPKGVPSSVLMTKQPGAKGKPAKATQQQPHQTLSGEATQ